MRNVRLTDEQIGVLIVMRDADAVSDESAKPLPDMGLERQAGVIARLRSFGLARVVQSGKHQGPYIYWLSPAGVARADAEKEHAAA